MSVVTPRHFFPTRAFNINSLPKVVNDAITAARQGDKNITKIKNENEQLIYRLRDEIEVSAGKDKEIEVLKKQMEDLTDQLGLLQDELEEERRENEQYKFDLDECHDIVDNCNNEILYLKERVNELDRENGKLALALKHSNIECSQWKTASTTWKDNCCDKEREIQFLHGGVVEMEETLEELVGVFCDEYDTYND